MIKQVLAFQSKLISDCYSLVRYPTQYNFRSLSIKDMENPIQFCQLACQEHSDCKGFTIKKNDACNLKNDVKSNVSIGKCE